MLFPFFTAKYRLLVLYFRSWFLSFLFIAFFCFFDLAIFKKLSINLSIFFKVIKTSFLSSLFKNSNFLNFLDPYTLIIFTNNLDSFVKFFKESFIENFQLFAFVFYQHFINLQNNNIQFFINYFTRYNNLFDYIYYFCVKMIRSLSIIFFFNFSYSYFISKNNVLI